MSTTWSSEPTGHEPWRALLVLAIASSAFLFGLWLPPAFCLGLTKDGQPRHPLMLAYDTERISWPVPAVLGSNTP